jgi:hypothetical protein
MRTRHVLTQTDSEDCRPRDKDWGCVGKCAFDIAFKPCQASRRGTISWSVEDLARLNGFELLMSAQN